LCEWHFETCGSAWHRELLDYTQSLTASQESTGSAWSGSELVVSGAWPGGIMKIFRHVYQIPSLVADRNLFQYLFVGDNTVLLDTGAAYTPSETISPFLKQNGIEPSQLTLAINTHADADHHGGNASLKQIAGQLMLACGEQDRLMIEDPDLLFASRYNQWIPDHGVGLGVDPEASAWVRKMVGPAQRIDQTFVGGEHIRIDDERSLQVLHVPGHSDGHLALYDRSNKAVFVGDALHGRYCPTTTGEPALPPGYYSVLAYLGTLQMLNTLDIEWIYSGHWPTFHGSQVSEFLLECRRFVDRASSLISKILEKRPEGVTLRALMDECGPVLGGWPSSNQWLLMYPLHGHLLLLEQQGRVTRFTGKEHVQWKIAS
jgi:glyoxylase-like metal-dependent hydrolase (beta-lactamase superfamily II)